MSGIWDLAQRAADEVATWPARKVRAADQALVTKQARSGATSSRHLPITPTLAETLEGAARAELREAYQTALETELVWSRTARSLARAVHRYLEATR